MQARIVDSLLKLIKTSGDTYHTYLAYNHDKSADSAGGIGWIIYDYYVNRFDVFWDVNDDIKSECNTENPLSLQMNNSKCGRKYTTVFSNYTIYAPNKNNKTKNLKFPICYECILKCVNYQIECILVLLMHVIQMKKDIQHVLDMKN